MANLKLTKIRDLLALSHALGDPGRGMAILGEGNASCRLTAGTFLVKASGSQLSTLKKDGVVECKSNVLLPLLDKTMMSDDEIENDLMKSRVSPKSKKPSVEALFHALLLSLPGVDYVGHTHAVAVNQILCSPRAKEFAEKRIFPDEIVCCGVASVFIPYTDPGFQLAKEIRTRTGDFIRQFGRPPRVVLMQNHGIITLGTSPQAVLAAMLMAEKSAAIWIGASTLGGPTFLSKQDVDRIAGRTDEHYRQRALKI